jgi:EAL domain-containing protein (putative c-di-GMP-specific phosphodiesterase class I)
MVEDALRLLRAYLGVDVVFVSQFLEGRRIFRFVDAAEPGVVTPGEGDPLDETYCAAVVDGRVPAYLPDPREHPVTAAMAVTETLPVGTHFSVPLRLSDGSVYGTFCAFNHEVTPELTEEDLDVVRLVASMVAGHVEEAELARRAAERRRRALQQLVPGQQLLTLVQPIVRLSDRTVVGAEALSRFPGGDGDPAAVFAEAWALGVGPDLELAAIAQATWSPRAWPAGGYLGINVSPATVVDERLGPLIDRIGPDRLVLELTEHVRVADYGRLHAGLAELRAGGLRLAIDDVGTGFSGLDHILRLAPDMLKIDGALVRGVDDDRGKRALLASLVTFATEVDAVLVAEQIETDAEAVTLQELGVGFGQGTLLGRPAPVARDP